SGVHTRRGMVAVDPRRIPLGSSIHVRGLRGVRDRLYAATDTGAAVKDNEIDVFIPDCRAAKAFGRQRVQVRIVRRGPIAAESLAANRGRSLGATDVHSRYDPAMAAVYPSHVIAATDIS